MTVSRKFLFGLACAVLSLALGYWSNHWHRSPISAPRTDSLPAISPQILRHAQDSLRTNQPIENDPLLQFRLLSAGELQSAWEALLQSRGSLPGEDWLRRWKALEAATCPYKERDEFGAMARWEDPGGQIQSSFFGSDKDPMGAIHKLDGLPNRIALLKILAVGNYTRDWITTADLYSKLANVDPADQEVMLDIVVSNWIQDEGTDTASVWLASQPASMITDLAARSVYVKSMGKNPALLEIIRSPIIRAQAQAMADAAIFAKAMGKQQ